jgi:aminopeptidase N
VIGAALPYFEQRYGRYPYAKLSVVIPPASALRAAGMEYPTLFVSAGAFWALPAWAPDPLQDIVSAHELAHQWFSGIIASNEVAYPLLDEGLAEWAALDFLRHYYRSPPSLFATRRAPFELFELVRALFLWRGGPVPSSLLPVTSYRHDTLARAVYMRPGLVFEAIAERFGRHALQAALARYAYTQRFGHPTPHELFEAFDATFGPGFARRILEPALAGEQPAALNPAPRPQLPTISGRTFGAELLFIAQALLHWLGA